MYYYVATCGLVRPPERRPLFIKQTCPRNAKQLRVILPQHCQPHCRLGMCYGLWGWNPRQPRLRRCEGKKEDKILGRYCEIAFFVSAWALIILHSSYSSYLMIYNCVCFIIFIYLLCACTLQLYNNQSSICFSFQSFTYSDLLSEFPFEGGGVIVVPLPGAVIQETVAYTRGPQGKGNGK